MANTSERLRSSTGCFPIKLSAESVAIEKFKKQLNAALASKPRNISELDSILSCELERRSAVVHSWKIVLQVWFSYTQKGNDKKAHFISKDN